MKLHNFQPPRLKKGRSRRTVIAWFVFLAGGSLIALSREMVATIDRAPFPDVVERWGPDGYSHFEDLIVLGGVLLALALSGLAEILCWSVSEFGPSLSRWFVIFAAMIFIVGVGVVWSHWEIWQKSLGLLTMS